MYRYLKIHIQALLSKAYSHPYVRRRIGYVEEISDPAIANWELTSASLKLILKYSCITECFS
jgi:hypothetical protein